VTLVTSRGTSANVNGTLLGAGAPGNDDSTLQPKTVLVVVSVADSQSAVKASKFQDTDAGAPEM